jgi:tetraacyldisaccharide 4'-kinase
MSKVLGYLIWILWPIGLIHYFVVLLRNKLYDFDILNCKRLPVPVVSVGNIQLGGTGKTPLIIELLTKLQESGLKIGILSRGYKRENSDEVVLGLQNEKANGSLPKKIGDEPAIISKYLENAAIGVGADRYRVALKLLKKASSDIIMLDDGFQHRKLYRDFDICMINVSKWQSHPFLYPFSYLRDTKSSLKRADAIILTKFGRNYQQMERIKKLITSQYKKPVFLARFSVVGLVKIPEYAFCELIEAKGKKAAAFSGLADCDDFFNLLRTEGFEVVYRKKLPDHYDYIMSDLRKIKEDSSRKGAEILITTEKDEVKITSLLEDRPEDFSNVYFLKVKLKMENEVHLTELIRKGINSSGK